MMMISNNSSSICSFVALRLCFGAAENRQFEILSTEECHEPVGDDAGLPVSHYMHTHTDIPYDIPLID